MNARTGQRLLWSILVVALVGLGTFSFIKWRGEKRNAPPLDDFGLVPTFSMIDQAGHPIGRNNFDGHIWIADLFFTRCTTVCPIMTGKMQSLQAALKDQPDIHLVSFSADPTNDTPDTLARYAAEHHADPKQWSFLTGSVNAIYSISKTGFHLPLDSVGGDQNPPIIHSSRLVLIDRHGHIRGYFNGAEPDVTQKVLAAIESLKQEQPE